MWEASAPEIDNKELLMEPEERAAIDCGREAIRLLRLGLANLDSPYTENTMDTSESLIAESRALLARCTEGA